MTDAGLRRLPDEWKEALDRPITSEEVEGAMNKEGGNEAPGRDGIGREFFKATWETLKGDRMKIFTQMKVNK
jgi:hypothetical protein